MLVVKAQDVEQLVLHRPQLDAALTAEGHRLHAAQTAHVGVAAATQKATHSMSFSVNEWRNLGGFLSQIFFFLQPDVPVQGLDVDVLVLVGARNEADAGGDGEGLDCSQDDVHLLGS